MSINILDLVKDQVGGQLAKQASQFLGESESNVSSALGGIIPAVLGGAIEKVSQPGGGEGLMEMIGGLDLDMLGNISGVFGSGESGVNSILNSGGGILESLLGSKTSGIIDLISGMSGLKKSSSGSLIKMAAPFIMGVIGKQVKGKGLSFLTDLLMGQKDNISKAMPAGMGSLLGLSSLGNIMESASDLAKGTASATMNTATDAVNTTVDAAKKGGNSLLKWLVPILIIAALGYWWMNKGSDKMVTEGMETVTDAAGNVIDAAGEATSSTVNAAGDLANDAANAVKDAANETLEFAKEAFEKVDEAGKATLDKISFAAGSVGSQIMDFMKGDYKGDGTFRFKNLNFATGSAQLSEEGQKEVDNLASIMAAYPNFKVEIHGHTDNVGDPKSNKMLSSARATAVMARLMGQGVDGSRVKAMGFGDERPVGDNETEEGRAQNRRIEAKLVK